MSGLKPCRFFNKPSGCRFGERCRFLHTSTAVAGGTAGVGTERDQESATSTQHQDNSGTHATTAMPSRQSECREHESARTGGRHHRARHASRGTTSGTTLTTPLRVSPSELRFTHNAISPIFSCGRHVNETITELIRDPTTPLPKLQVVSYEGKLFSMSNRRLYCWRKVANHWEKKLKSGDRSVADTLEGRTVLVENIHFFLVAPNTHFFRGLSTQDDGVSVKLFAENYCELCSKHLSNPIALMQHRDRLHRDVLQDSQPDRHCSHDGTSAAGSTHEKAGKAPANNVKFSCKLCHAVFTLESALAQHKTLCVKRKLYVRGCSKDVPAPTNVTREIVLRKDVVGEVIGPYGVAIRRLEMRFHLVKLSVVHPDRTKPAVLRLVGSEFYVNNALRKLRMYEERSSESSESSCDQEDRATKGAPLRFCLRACVIAQKSEALLVVEREKLPAMKFAQLYKLVRDKLGIRKRFGFLEARHRDKPDGEVEAPTVLKEEGPVFRQFVETLLATSDTEASEWMLSASGH